MFMKSKVWLSAFASILEQFDAIAKPIKVFFLLLSHFSWKFSIRWVFSYRVRQFQWMLVNGCKIDDSFKLHLFPIFALLCALPTTSSVVHHSCGVCKLLSLQTIARIQRSIAYISRFVHLIGNICVAVLWITNLLVFINHDEIFFIHLISVLFF